MFDAIDPRSPTPLYEQIATQVRLAVAAGELASGDSLPSVRRLSRRLRVNPATVVQAYRELEADGFVETRHGAGTFVRDVPGARREEERGAQARRIARDALQDAARVGIPASDLIDAILDETGEGGPGEAQARDGGGGAGRKGGTGVDDDAGAGETTGETKGETAISGVTEEAR